MRVQKNENVSSIYTLRQTCTCTIRSVVHFKITSNTSSSTISIIHKAQRKRAVSVTNHYHSNSLYNTNSNLVNLLFFPDITINKFYIKTH